MYEADPFAARKAVDERQEAAAKKREQKTKESSSGSGLIAQTSPEFAHSPEAKMASSLRDLVEQSIKNALEMYPEAQDSLPTTLEEDQKADVVKRLETLGFTPVQARQAMTALSSPSPLASALLASLGPLQASIEYLILHVPECDLPQRFLPTVNSSNPFISSAHAGTEDLKARWIRDKAVKECGWPEHIVQECVLDARLTQDWPALVKTLNDRLMGDLEPYSETGDAGSEPVDNEELESFQARFVADNHLELPLPIAPFQIHILLRADHMIPTQGDAPPMYITSKVVAAYVRLHLLSSLILAFREGTLVQPGESVVMAIVRFLEEAWALIEDEGPPNMSDVLRYLLPSTNAPPVGDDESKPKASSTVHTSGRRRRAVGVRDDRADSQVKIDFETMRASSEYKKLLKIREKLPAFAVEDKFIAMLQKSRCVVVVGETGSGKTTQLPQFVLDYMISENRGASASIIVTQPRRLSAIGVAARVSAERADDGSIGYAIRGESKQDKRTKLLFCTTGVVLRRLGSGDKLNNVTHVIVDEVHERSVDGDFLLLELKELLKHHPSLKVILMSATINHEVFVKYFDGAPLLTIPGLTYPVEDLYLEDHLPRLSYTPSAARGNRRLTEQDKKDMSEEFGELGLDTSIISAIQTIVSSDRIDFELIASVVRHITATATQPGGILIFLPGVQDIRQCIEGLRSLDNSKVFPLHANLSSNEQRAVFAPVSGWKVVVATNVAETSITIDDIIYVIDSGKVKETQYDVENGLTRLNEQWVTRAAAKQRRGRAGRTQPGICYKLYTRRQEARMGAYPIPEIRRVALESVSLTVKVVHNDVKSFLSRAMDPPAMAAIDHALAVLSELGAITETGELTPMGQYLAMLPMDLRLGKVNPIQLISSYSSSRLTRVQMLVLGSIFQCLGPILAVAACLSSKPLFFSPFDKREEATLARQRFATENSDLLTDNFISVTTVRDINTLRQEFLSSLISLNLVPDGSSPTSSALNTNSEHVGLVKAILLAGLWPRVARVSLPPGAIKFDRVQAGTIQRANEAKEFKFFDIRTGPEGGRVFLHPASSLFHSAEWRSPFVTYFQKQMTSKVFLRDATEVPIYALLLFGGPVAVNHIGGGLVIGSRDAFVKLKAWPRIGVLVNQLRRLLDIQLKQCVDEGTMLEIGRENPVVQAEVEALERHTSAVISRERRGLDSDPNYNRGSGSLVADTNDIDAGPVDLLRREKVADVGAEFIPPDVLEGGG
ncbi:hypothetical protein NM688_g2729 [Phlebia brevispora]|uniref:Uncharacterized protein n=1 Tax=Phlebia brevispora TaxID=194682 RepID=A0ACC1T7J6_9APHY|nr:hypothetical protein NM688_g2729 [Phlebia brevispora]